MSYKNRNIYLINKPFQLRFSFYVCSWLVASSLIYPFLISNLFEYLFHYIALDPMGPALPKLAVIKEDLIRMLILIQAVFLLTTFLISLFMSHRIAGPLYKLRIFFALAQKGDLSKLISFRKKDYFQELVPAYNDMIQAIAHRIQQKDQCLDQIQKDLQAHLTKNSLTEIKEGLKSTLQRMVQS